MTTFCLIIYRGQDEVHMEVVSRNELEKQLDDNWYGPLKFISKVSHPRGLELEYFPEETMIIVPYDPIIPEKVEIVTKHKLC